MKEKSVRARQCPFMNAKLRKASLKKAQLFNKYNKYRTSANREAYRQQRNLTTKLERQSVRTYFNERCAGGPKSKDVWPTVKPFLSNKGLLNEPVIILCENVNIVSEQAAVSGILNQFYLNVARDIGNGLSPDEIETHSSIHAIRAKFLSVTPFDFNPITNERVNTFIGKSSSKKSLQSRTLNFQID